MAYKRYADPIGDEIPIAKMDLDAPQTEVTCLRGTWSHGPVVIREEALAALENFPAGKTSHWVFSYNEIHYILEGKAEMTYTLAQTRHTKAKTVTIQKGDCYIIPVGADITWEVDPSGPLKKFCAVMPAPASYLPGSMIRPDGNVLA
ncbi:cupin domain-containing protein [Chloroflexota bacterium]